MANPNNLPVSISSAANLNNNNLNAQAHSGSEVQRQVPHPVAIPNESAHLIGNVNTTNVSDTAQANTSNQRLLNKKSSFWARKL